MKTEGKKGVGKGKRDEVRECMKRGIKEMEKEVEKGRRQGR